MTTYRQLPIVKKVKLEKPLALRAEVWLHRIEPPMLDHLARQVDRYGISEVAFAYPWENGGSAFNAYPFASQVRKEPDGQALAEFRAALRRMKQLGLKTILIAPEPAYPKTLFEVLPEFRNATAGGFWKFIEDKTAEIFQQLPDLDAFQFYLWEKGFVHDGHVFSDLHVVPGHCSYGRTDYLVDLVKSYARGAQRAGRRAELLTFSHFPWQEQVLIEALREMDRHLPLTLMHKFVSGDFDIFRPTNRVIAAAADRPAAILFDVEGEYYGKSEAPFCYPEEIQARLQHALEQNPHIETIAGRAIVLDGDCFGSLNEVNFYALMRLARDPYLPVEDIWQGWAEDRFGAPAAPKVISALRRTYDIGRLIYYFRGTRAHQHSKVGSLRYLDWIVDAYALTMARWRPDDFMMKYWLDELANNPREHTVEWVVADRREALRLCDLSLADIEEAARQMPADASERLLRDVHLLRDFAEVSLYHAEALVRYFIEKKKRAAASSGNRESLEAALKWLEQRAAELDGQYGPSRARAVPATHTTGFILDPSLIRDYVREVRQALRDLGMSSHGEAHGPE